MQAEPGGQQGCDGRADGHDSTIHAGSGNDRGGVDAKALCEHGSERLDRGGPKG